MKPEWIEAATRLPSIQIPAAIPVDSNTPVGRVIWRTPVPAPNPQFITNINIGCNGTMSATGLNNGVPGEPLEPNQVYRTNVDGVGYRILNSRHRFPFQITRNLGSWRWPNTVEMEDLAFELVKTGPITFGAQINGGVYGSAAILTADSQTLPVLAISVAAGGAVKVLPCTPDNRNPTIPLGRVSTTVLESATGMSFRNFSVSLKCDQAVDITVNVNADSDAPAQGLINANQGSQAKGFVVELREHRADGSSTPFVLNTDHQYSNNGRDDTVLSFRARLKKKSATGAIALGDFSALATIQLSYE
ncbi:fimbrial protein [Candidatus Glomeribacter gigasporarum]|uniref:fimbrial protein n=1 Tax=Candidatus Glomeribacter gigasporarum TaxID=132144 RepID=UPI00193A4802|nr:fimbrial protein [Candidatus Glomeribacter gigasporarum]